MTTTKKNKNTAQAVQYAGMLAIILTPIALAAWALFAADDATLRWWAGIATLIALVGIPAAFALGRFGARERIAGMDVALNKVAQAGKAAIDLRGQARQQYSVPPSPAPAAPPIDPARIVVTSTHPANAQREIVEM